MKLLTTLSALALISGSASAATLGFSGDICGGGGPCGNGSEIDQSYGDIVSQLDIAWDANRGTAELDNVLHWNGGYEDLGNVAYALNSGTGMSIQFLASSGWDVLLAGFSIARYANRVTDTSVQVIDLADDSVLFDSGTFSTTVDDSIDYVLNAQSSVGIEILFGPDAWNVGISDISYFTTETVVAAVPLPAGLPLLAGGLFAMGWMRRKQRD